MKANSILTGQAAENAEGADSDLGVRRDIECIQRVVAEHLGRDLGVMRAAVRTVEAAWARQVGMFFARRLTPASLQVVARAFGKRDHGTTMHAMRKVRERCQVSAADAATVAEIEVKLRMEGLARA